MEPRRRPPKRTQFAAYSTRWLANRDLRPRTRQTYKHILTRRLLPTFGEHQLAAIAPQDVRDWHSELLPGKPAMRSQCYALLRAILNTALSDELITANPCRIRGAGATQRARKIRPATVHELAELTAAMPDRLKLAVPLASWCALRFGELIELRRGDIDINDEVIRFRRAAAKAHRRQRRTHHRRTKEPRRNPQHQHPATPTRTVEDHLTKHVAPQRDALLFPSIPGGTHHLTLVFDVPRVEQSPQPGRSAGSALPRFATYRRSAGRCDRCDSARADGPARSQHGRRGAEIPTRRTRPRPRDRGAAVEARRQHITAEWWGLTTPATLYRQSLTGC